MKSGFTGKQHPSKKNKRTSSRNNGQGLIEFALVAPILLLLISGIIDLGRAFYTSVAMASMVSEGAHWAATYPGCIPYATDDAGAPAQCKNNNKITQRMCNENTDLDPSRFTAVSVAPAPGQANQWTYVNGIATPPAGQEIVFTVKYKIQMITPIIRGIFGTDLELTSTATEVVRGSGTPTSTASTPPSPCNNVALINQPSPPENPRNVETGCTPSTITLGWDWDTANNLPPTGFRIYKDSALTQQVDPTGIASPGDILWSNMNTSASPMYSTVLSNTPTDYYVVAYIKDSNGVVVTSASEDVSTSCPQPQWVMPSTECNPSNVTQPYFTWKLSTINSSVSRFDIYETTDSTGSTGLTLKTSYSPSNAGTSIGPWTDSNITLTGLGEDGRTGVSGVTPEYWVIKAVNSSGSNIGVQSLTHQLPGPNTCIEQPQTPTNFAQLVNCNGTGTLQWNAVADANDYELTGSSGTVDVGNVTQKSGLTPGSYSLIAYYGSIPSTSVSTTLSCTLPDQVTGVTQDLTTNAGKYCGYTSPNFTGTLKWTAVSGSGITYKIYKSTDLTTVVATTGSTSYSGLPANQTYGYEVVASTTNGDGQASSSATLTCQTPLVSSVTVLCSSTNASSSNYTEVSVSWSDSNNTTNNSISGYKISWTQPSSGSLTISGSTATSYTPVSGSPKNSYAPGGTFPYGYTVQAVDSSGNTMGTAGTGTLSAACATPGTLTLGKSSCSNLNGNSSTKNGAVTFTWSWSNSNTIWPATDHYKLWDANDSTWGPITISPNTTESYSATATNNPVAPSQKSDVFHVEAQTASNAVIGSDGTYTLACP